MNKQIALAGAAANVRAEEAIIGKLIGDAPAYWSVADVLDVKHFSRDHHRDIFAAVEMACKKNIAPTISFLEAHLPENWADVGDVEPVLQILVEKAADVESPTDFADELISCWQARQQLNGKARPVLATITPINWKNIDQAEQRWLASARIPAGDLTIMSGNGGSGKTEIALQLLIYLTAGSGDWLGCTIEAGVGLLLSCEEPEENVRDRVERICKHRGINPVDLAGLHMVFPELDQTWLCTVDRFGRMTRAPLLDQIEAWIEAHRPLLLVIDSVAAVFDGDAIARRQVRSFLAMLRKIARRTGVAILLLDHPSVRGMTDGTGTANSVDWRNSVRSMLHLSDPEKDDPDARTLTVMKSNRGRAGEKVELRWNGLTFTTSATDASSPHRVAAERNVDDLFLRLLDKRNAQARPVHAKSAKGSAPSEFALDPEANGVAAEGFRGAMERLLRAGRIIVVESGPSSKRRSHLERASA
jgi:RecA-family ATPase